jgi:hypothetical protein
MKKPSEPLNIDLLIIPKNIKEIVRPVTALDIYVGAGSNFHPDGLYSVETFGVMGTPQRLERFSWISLKLEIFHPAIFNAICKLKSLYGDIITGREFAKFNTVTKDFEKVGALEKGETGFDFFIRNWEKINFPKTASDKRDELIEFVTKRKDKCMLDCIYVLPAGYRDITIDENGRESSDDINKLYYKLIAISNTVNVASANASPEMYNSQRLSMQNAVCEIYLAMLKIVKGKNNLFMGKWMSRKVAGSTRNVLTAMPMDTKYLQDPGAPTMNDTAVGIYQYIHATARNTIFQLRTGFLSTVFAGVGAPALLVDKKTLKAERTQISNKTFDRWMTTEGLRKVMATYEEPSIRWKPIEIEGKYLGLIYRGPDQTFKFINGLDELPDGRDKNHCTPITLTELFYISVYMKSREYVSHVTRYPIGSNRSTYPSSILLMSTVNWETRTPLDDTWRRYTADAVSHRFPIINSDTFNSMAPHPCRHAKLNADHDGDTGSFIVTTSTESIAEFKNIKSKREFYLDIGGGFVANFEPDTVAFVNRALTGG